MCSEHISVLVPAYNEEPRIANVLDVVCSYKRATKTVVIDDGSQDGTADSAARYPVQVLGMRVIEAKAQRFKAVYRVLA